MSNHRTQTPRTLEQIGADEARFWLKTLASCGITPESLMIFARALDAGDDAAEMRDEDPGEETTTVFDVIESERCVSIEDSGYLLEVALGELTEMERAARVLGIDATGGMEDKK